MLRTSSLLAVLSLLLLAGGLSACGDDDSVSQEELTRATEEAKEQAESEAELDQLRAELDKLKEESGGSTGGATGGGTSAGGGTSSGGSGSGGGVRALAVPDDAVDCGSSVYANAGTTSCGFALNVAAAYFDKSVPGLTFDVSSPATGETYTMTCSPPGPLVQCEGGNSAVVWFNP